MGLSHPPATGVANLPALAPASGSRKRPLDLTQSEPRKRQAQSKPSPKKDQGEKRPRRWRSHPTQAFNERLERAMSQRMFVLDRERDANPTSPSEKITMAGTTGNLYTVTVACVPTCNCPDSSKGNNASQCKHIVYATNRVLKVPAQLRYQLSFLPAELLAIFAASPLATDTVTEEDSDTEHPSNRKSISGDCPVCFCDMDDDDPKDIVWCKAACGNNLHKSCFNQWARSSKVSSGKVRCVYCRTDWEAEGVPAGSEGWNGTAEELAALKANANVGADGYANIASSLGIDGHRDYSTYHQPWANQRRSGGYGGRYAGRYGGGYGGGFAGGYRNGRQRC